jgi:DNA-binding transcriptional ArsR family regulator
MPEEFEYKDYKNMEEYGKTIEGSNYLHSLYLKAVNHPTRREILNIINEIKRISKNNLLKELLVKNIVSDESSFKYNMDYLIKAFCVKKIEDGDEIYFEITQSGRVVNYLK